MRPAASVRDACYERRVLSPQQRAELETLGFTRLTAFTREQAAVMQDAVWEVLGRVHGIRRDDRDTWTVARPSRLDSVAERPAFDAIAGAALCGAIDALLGAGAWAVPRRWGALLVTFPGGQRPWSLPSALWHADFIFSLPAKPLPGVKVFVYLADQAARGGGTLLLAGSHRLAERFAATRTAAQRADTRRMRVAFFASHAWLRELVDPNAGGDRVARFMHDGAELDGVRLRVVDPEVQAGEVILTHPWLMHCGSSNRAALPRMMRAMDIHRLPVP